MIKISDTVPTEKSTITFDLTFTDEDGETIAPASVIYSLMNYDETIINDIEDVEVDAGDLGTTVTIVLSDDDLQILTSERYSRKVYRFLVVEATYNSDLGTELTVNETIRFKIENLIGIS